MMGNWQIVDAQKQPAEVHEAVMSLADESIAKVGDAAIEELNFSSA